ncbi:pimeloyl-ACP methyl ester carboxylesterase [Sphingomonas sp. UYAg733]
MARYILVPGGWHGGWAYAAVSTILSSLGHDVQAITLRGLGDDPAVGINLERHIEEVACALRDGDTAAVLVGHSYGGMIITGAADREPSLVKALVYADAYVPQDGESVWQLAGPRYRDLFIAGVAADGMTCAPPPHLDQRCRPHPMATFLQAIKLSGAWYGVPEKAFIAASGWEGSPFTEISKNLERNEHWATFTFDCAHDIPRLAPDRLASVLLKYL